MSFLVCFQFLVHYLKTLEEWIGYNPTARLSWALLQDFHHDSSIVTYPPQAVALGAMQLAMSCYGAQVPLCSVEGKNSFAGVRDIFQQNGDSLIFYRVVINYLMIGFAAGISRS